MNLRWHYLWMPATAATLGVSGVIGQVLLWREILTLYQGNELTTGIILANWVLAEACGAWCGAKSTQTRRRVFRTFSLLTVLFLGALPAAMCATRLLRPWLGIALGEPVGPVFISISSLILLLPVSFLHGALFPIAGRLYRQERPSCTGAAIGNLYVWECLGNLLGGLLLLAYFLSGGHGFRLVAFLWVANAAILLNRPGQRHVFAINSASRTVMGLVVTVTAWIVLMTGADRLHTWSQIRQHHPYRLLGSSSSPHGNWTVLDGDGQYLFMLDGQPTYLIPVPDRVAVEVFAHLPLLIHPRPERGCVISGGAGGVLDEILKHPTMQRVDYTEQDPVFLELLNRHSTQLIQRELQSPRVHVHTRDGRRFLQKSETVYDLIWMGLPEPSTLHANRYFTREFFQILSRRLADDGIVVLGLPGRMAYASYELRLLHASLYETLKGVFPHVRMFPGDGRYFFLASPAIVLSEFHEEDLIQAVAERDLADTIGMPWHLEQRLHRGWTSWIEEEYHDLPSAENRDLRPLALFHFLSYQQAAHAPHILKLLRGLQQYGRFIATAVAFLLLAVLILRLRHRPAHAPPVLSQIATTGFAGMMFDLLVIFAFQSAVGYLHVWIGLLVAAFMAGAAISASISTRWAGNEQNLSAALRACDLLLCAFALCLPLVLGIATRLASRAPITAIFLFLVINFVAGSLTGAQFPLAAAWRSRWEEAGRASGVLQAADLVGGWIAGLLGAALLLPLLGGIGTCAVILALKGLIHWPFHVTISQP